MKSRKAAPVILAFVAGLVLGIATGYSVSVLKSADRSDLARFGRGTISGNLSVDQIKAVLADCTRYANLGYIYVFAPDEPQKAKCLEITSATYEHFCTILAGSSNPDMAISQIRSDLSTTVASMLGSLQITLTSGQLIRFSAFSQEVQQYFKTNVGSL
jgi:hypothetical protein